MFSLPQKLVKMLLEYKIRLGTGSLDLFFDFNDFYSFSNFDGVSIDRLYTLDI